MCDFVGGEVIVAFPVEDPAGRGLIDELREPSFRSRERSGIGAPPMALRESMHDRFVERGLEKGQAAWANDLYLVSVDRGAEQAAAVHLSQDYTRRVVRDASYRDARAVPLFFAQPNAKLRSQASASSGSPVVFEDLHQTFKRLVALDPEPVVYGTAEVVILDSGTGLMQGIEHVDAEKSVIDVPGSPIADTFGHGSLVCGIVEDACPSARVTSIRVFDREIVAEWNLLAALLMADVAAADVVNISLDFGLADVDCPNCGRSGRGARSAVFEHVLGSVLTAPDGPVVVAAAGNGGVSELAFPARYGSVVGVGSLTAREVRSTFSNYGARDERGGFHESLFFAPGGEARTEAIASCGGAGYWGTSFAAAYATAVIASLAPSFADREALMAHLRATASANDIEGFDFNQHGNGLIRYQAP